MTAHDADLQSLVTTDLEVLPQDTGDALVSGAIALPRRLERAAVRRSHAEDLAILRRVLPWGTALWSLYVLSDLASIDGDAERSIAIALRLGSAGIAGILTSRLLRTDPGPRAITWLNGSVGVGAAIVLGALTACYHDVGASPGAGVFAMVIYVSATLARRFTVALGMVVGIPIAYGLTVLGLTRIDPVLAASWDVPSSFNTFRASLTNSVGAILFGAWLSDSMRRLREDLAQTRDLGRYRLLRRLGRGGMGEVWAAWHPSLRREVAVKVLRIGLQDTDAETRMRFEREVDAMARLTHPNTVRILDYGVDEDGLPYYAMDLLQGRTLARAVRDEGAPDTREALRWFRDACEALGEAHALGIVHRDVKPENLFLAEVAGRGRVIKLMDFGIARRLDDPRKTRAGHFAGTPAYVAPELLRGEPSSPASDVYAVGVALYYTLSGGRLPYEHKDVQATIAAITTGKHPSLTSWLDGTLPSSVEALVSDCMNRDPDLRPADGHAVADRLEALLETTPSDDGGAPRPQPDGVRSTRTMSIEEL